MCQMRINCPNLILGRHEFVKYVFLLKCLDENCILYTCITEYTLWTQLSYGKIHVGWLNIIKMKSRP